MDNLQCDGLMFFFNTSTSQADVIPRAHIQKKVMELLQLSSSQESHMNCSLYITDNTLCYYD